MRTKLASKTLALFLAVCMVMTMLPTAVFAEADGDITTFLELQSALSSTTPNSNITLGDNIRLGGGITLGADHTLNTNGYTLWTDNQCITTKDYTLTINGGGMVNIPNGADYPGIKSTPSSSEEPFYGTLNLENVTINLTNGKDARGLEGISINVGTDATINLNSNKNEHIILNENNTLTINSGGTVNFTNFRESGILNDGTVHINGGTLNLGATSGGNSSLKCDSDSLLKYTSGTLTADAGGTICLEQGARVEGLGGRLKDRNTDFTAAGQVTVGGPDAAPSANGLTKGIYTYNSTSDKFEKSAIQITTEPQNVTVTQGAITGSLTVAATTTNGNPVSYQWYNGDTYIPIDGETGSSFSIPTDLEAGTYHYYCVLNAEDCMNVSTGQATVTVNPPGGTPTYTITLNANGGNALSPGTLTTGNGRLETLPTPTRSGSYSFVGWFTAASGGTAVTTDTLFTANSTIYAHWTYQGGGSGGGGSGGGSSGGSSGGGGGTPSEPIPEPGQTISDQSITTTDNETKVDLTQGGTRLTPEQTASLIRSNQNQPVQIQGQGFTITFPKGSMSETAGQSVYDFGLEITTLTGQSGSEAQGQNQQAQAMLALADGSGVMALSFKHSGPLPGTASIEINVGKEYAGQTLYYYYHNPETNKLEFRQSAQVDSNGKLIITQDRCSNYLLSTTLLGIEAKDRIWGQNRYLTAVNIAKEYFLEGASTVILAQGDSSADALPAVPLAKYYNAPLLLTPSAKLPAEVLEQIKSLKAQKVILIGGTNAISPEIAEVLKEKGLEVERIFGANRYETASEIAQRLNTLGVNKESPTAILVNGNKAESAYADALSVSAWAGYKGIPILYADSTLNTLSKATEKSFKELGITKTILIGGTGVLPAGLEKNVPNPMRYSGKNRFATNAAVLKGLQEKPVNVYAVTGLDYADALAVAAVAARDNSWLILTGAKGTPVQVRNGLTKEQQQLLTGQKGLIQDLRVFGGQSVIIDETLAVLKALVGK